MKKMETEDFVRCDKPHSRWFRTEPDDGRRWKESGHLMLRVLRTKAEMDEAVDRAGTFLDGGVITPPRLMRPKR